ncbi:cuticle protein AMP4-like [Portunus trituberculatus]|uniref:cuticle protein AMP4-like n=1 Tax=Portunus trituberculatus TaxID=210409 RepID=UPI001E1D2172|nr:cuticle protein AMP4-like [Portunus trituberculatus]
MKIAIVLCLAALVAAEKLPAASPPPPVAILLQSQVNPDALGAHSSNFESEDGISVSQSGSESLTGGSNIAGSFSFPINGEIVTVTYVADEGGFRPDSVLLPVAPQPLHPMPQHAIDQIEKARLEDEAKAREEAAAPAAARK